MKNLKDWFLSALVAFLITLVLISTFIATMFYSFKKQTTVITDIDKYPKIISRWKKSAPEIVAHFPNEIPSEASDVYFYFSPCFLQADGHIELMFKTQTDTIDTYHKKFKEIATQSYKGGHHHPIYTYKNIDEKSFGLPEDFEIMFFQPDPENTPEHKPEYGVVISKKENIIIFWANAVIY